MAWSNLELTPASTNSPIEAYHRMDDRVLSWFDRRELRSLSERLVRDRTHPATKEIYLGWLAYETATIAENHGRNDLALQEYNDANEHWCSLVDHPDLNDPLVQLKLFHAISLTGLKAQIVSERYQRPAETTIPLEATRRYLAQRSGFAYQKAIDNPRGLIERYYVGLGTELLFSSLMLDYSEGGERKRIPFVTPPRSESPHNAVNAAKTIGLWRAYDADLQTYDKAWHPEEAYRVQLKHSYNHRTRQRYDTSKIVIIEADAHMHVNSIQSGIALAKALASDTRTQTEQNHISNAMTNINDELAQSTSIKLLS